MDVAATTSIQFNSIKSELMILTFAFQVVVVVALRGKCDSVLSSESPRCSISRFLSSQYHTWVCILNFLCIRHRNATYELII